MQVCMEKWCAEQLAKALSLIERANDMTHNEITWERKQEAISNGLGIIKDLLATSVEFDVTEHLALLRKSMDLTAETLNAVTGGRLSEGA